MFLPPRGTKKARRDFKNPASPASLAETKSMLPAAADVDGLKGCNGPTFPVSVGLGNFLRPSASFSGRKNDGGEKEGEEVTKLLRGLLHRTDGRGRTTLSHTVWRRMRPRRALLDMKGERERSKGGGQTAEVIRFPTAPLSSERIGASFPIHP